MATKFNITAFDLAQRFIGVEEIAGATSNPHIISMLRLDNKWPAGDDVAWCSAFVNYIAWLLRLPRSKSLRARSWLNIGLPVHLENAEAGNDIVILKRAGDESGPEIINAPGHVGFYAGVEADDVLVLGGNQGDAVNVSRFHTKNILGIRRIA